nr:hypothetical protein [Tanacetum cinerariifolium]
MGDEHLNTIPAIESDEFIKSCVENLVPNPSESEDERECDVPVCDDFTTFSNLLFDADDDFPLLTTSHFLLRTFRRKSIRAFFLIKKSFLLRPDGIESSRVRDESISSIRESLSSMRIEDGEKDLIAALEFLELNSSRGRGDELSYNNLSIKRISSSRSQLDSSILGGINLKRMTLPTNSSRRESILEEEIIKES